MAELLTFIFEARGRIMMLLVLSIAVIVVTYLIFTISGRSTIIKYLPGALLLTAGLYYLYRGMQQLTTQSGLNELVSAVMFVVIGLVGICTAMILGIYHQGEGQKTKRRVQALDYLQEARSVEPVEYPKREKTTMEAFPASRKQDDAVTEYMVDDSYAKTPDVKIPETEESQESKERQLTELRKKERLEQNEAKYAEHLSALDEETKKLREERSIARLEKQLDKKNAQRKALIEYNERAEKINESEQVKLPDQISLFVQRNKLAFNKRISDMSFRVESSFSNVCLTIQRALRKFRLDINRIWGRFRSRVGTGEAESEDKEE